jgi:ketosteroid isomerase-like protein
VERHDVDRWLERYVAAWRSYDRAEIEALFSADARYRYHAYDDPIVGGEAIAASWLQDPDEPGSFDARYECFAVDGDRAVAVGTSTYPAAGDAFENVFLLEFDADGRCREFTEWYVKRP